MQRERLVWTVSTDLSGHNRDLMMVFSRLDFLQYPKQRFPTR